jgi:hypothetical protein
MTMQNNEQSKFIRTPITDILKDTVNACNGIGQGIETQSLGEYVLQTTFLKMTGASEQKLKCICWEMATRDYAYRYQYLKKNYGECSSYADKNSIYKDLIDRILAIDSDFSIDRLFEDVDISEKIDELIEKKIKEAQKKQEANKNRVLNTDEIQRLEEGIRLQFNKNGISDKDKSCFTRMVLFENIQDKLEDILDSTLIERWEQNDYLDYISLWKGLSCYSFAQGEMLLCKELHKLYTDIVYVHRNRCAHNLLSYQNNLPTLKTLLNENFVYDNYYFRFSILILLDEIFVRLYKAYMELIKKRY